MAPPAPRPAGHDHRACAGSPAARGDRPVLRAGSAAQRPHPVHPGLQKVLELALREAVALHDTRIGVEHIMLALTTVKQGLVPAILSEAGTSAAALRAGLLDRHRRAS